MNRLIKAEWYRIRRSEGLMKWLLVIGMVVIILPLANDFEAYQYSLDKYLPMADLFMFVPQFISIFCSVMVGISYLKKTAYYEVMSGNKISHILMSKMVADALLVTAVESVIFGICWTVVGVRNGVGKMTQIPLRFVLLMVIIFHVCVVGVLITTSFRHIGAAILVYMRFTLFDLLVLFIIKIFEDNLSTEVLEKIADWFTMVKLTKILNHEYLMTDHLIFTVIVGMLIEGALWYAVSYIGMKKKLY